MNGSKTQGAVGLWLATDKSLMLIWAEVGGEVGSNSGLPGKMTALVQAQNPVLFPPEKAPQAIRERLLAYVAQQNRQCGAIRLAACRSADYRRDQAGKLIQRLANGLKSDGVSYDSRAFANSAAGEATLFSAIETGHKEGIAGVWVATDDGLIVMWSDTTPTPQNSP